MNTSTNTLQQKRWLKAGLTIFMAIILLAGTLLNFAPARAKTAGPEAVIAWNDIAQQTLVASGKTSPVQMMIYMAYVNGAVYDAVVNIAGGYKPYNLEIKKHPDASVDAAVATAAYEMLVHYLSSQKSELDTQYAAAMSAIPDGPAKDEGVLVGKLAAKGMIDLRMNDGLESDIGFTMPSPGPGVWELPSDQSPHTPWASQLKPFLLRSPDQFRPAPPPELTSKEWARAYNEIKEYGSATSTVRTDEQTEIARFWGTQPAIQYFKAFADISRDRQFDAVQAARLYAMGTMVGSDALIACFDAKYTYLFWRPVFAIPQGETDGNPRTAGDSNWKPAIGTPNHPEYPSAHGCLTTAMSEVFVKALGTRQIEVDLKANLPNQPEVVRHYRTANELVREMGQARVWGGIHYRFSVAQGVLVGKKVGHWTLKTEFQPTK